MSKYEFLTKNNTSKTFRALKVDSSDEDFFEDLQSSKRGFLNKSFSRTFRALNMKKALSGAFGA